MNKKHRPTLLMEKMDSNVVTQLTKPVIAADMWRGIAPESDGLEEDWRIEHEDFHADE